MRSIATLASLLCTVILSAAPTQPIVGLTVPAPGLLANQAGPALTSLTVPDTSLPSGCRLRPIAPAVTSVSEEGTVTVVTSSPPSSFPFPSNPWLGADHRLVVDVRRRIDGTPAVPDGPPPSAAELSARESRWVEHVVEGYHAVYDSADGSVTVSAIRFDDPSLAATSPSVSDLLQASSGRRDRLVLGAVVVQVSERRAVDCFEAVAAHVRALR